MKKIAVILLGVSLALALAACGGAAPPTNEITVVGTDAFAFEPANTTTSVGTPTKITLSNTGVLEHSLVIDELSVRMSPVPAGQSANQTFTPSVAGTYVVYCDIPGHTEAGMVGTLVVNP